MLNIRDICLNSLKLLLKLRFGTYIHNVIRQSYLRCYNRCWLDRWRTYGQYHRTCLKNWPCNWHCNSSAFLSSNETVIAKHVSRIVVEKFYLSLPVDKLTNNSIRRWRNIVSQNFLGMFAYNNFLLPLARKGKGREFCVE